MWPEEYRRGIGGGAGDALRAFAEAGGRIVAISESTPWVIDAMGLPVIAEGGRGGDAYAPGTLLRVELNRRVGSWRGACPARSVPTYASGYRYTPRAWPGRTIVAARYADRDLLVAGFLDGGKVAGGERRPCCEVPVGEGDVVLFGFHPQRQGPDGRNLPAALQLALALVVGMHLADCGEVFLVLLGKPATHEVADFEDRRVENAVPGAQALFAAFDETSPPEDLEVLRHVRLTGSGLLHEGGDRALPVLSGGAAGPAGAGPTAP